MAQIIYSVAGDGRIQLAGDEFERSMDIGAFWTRLRIIVRCSMVGTATTGAIVGAIGLTEGNQSPYSRPGTKAFVGVYVSNGGVWTYNAGAPAYFTGNQGMYSVVRTNGVESSNLTNLGYTPGIAQVASGIRSTLAVDLAKNNTTYSVKIWVPNTAAAQTDHTTYQLLLDAENELTPLSLSSAALTAVTSTGYLDTVSIYWSSKANPIEISDVMAIRFA